MIHSYLGKCVSFSLEVYLRTLIYMYMLLFRRLTIFEQISNFWGTVRISTCYHLDPVRRLFLTYLSLEDCHACQRVKGCSIRPSNLS